MRLLAQYLLLFVYAGLYIAGLELMRYARSFWYVGMAGMIVATLLLMWYLCKKKFNRRWLQFSAAPIIFFLASFWFSMFLSQPWFYHVFAVLVATIFWIYFEQVLLYFYYPLKYFPYTLENFAYYIGLLAFFFLMSGLYGFMILLQVATWLLALIAALGAFIINFEIFWNQKIEWGKGWLFNLIILLIVVELFIAIGFLPTGYYVNAAILALVYYLLTGLAKSALTGYLTRRTVLTHALIAAGCLLVVLLTAQWI
jgi:hypothetical protein